MEKKDILIIIIIVILIVFAGMIFFGEREEVDPYPEEANDIEIPEEEEEDEDDEVETFENELYETVDYFIGKPQKSGPLDEEVLYTEEGFDSTTLVLSVVARTISKENPEEIMKEINYYPPGEISYENRLHFSSYRNKVSDYFEDITTEVGGNYVEEKDVLLNKERDDEGRLIDIDWEEEITLTYIPKIYVPLSLPDLPLVSGVMFVMDGSEEIGLDVRGEGIILDGERFVYASREEGEVIEVDFMEYLEDSGYDGVSFYRFLEK